MTTKTRCHDLLFGLAVGDPLGMPVEFKSRSQIFQQSVTHMTGFSTYHLPPSAFSDDNSLAFCLAETPQSIAVDNAFASGATLAAGQLVLKLKRHLLAVRKPPVGQL